MYFMSSCFPVKRFQPNNRIPFHEKNLGQLFCDHKSQDILNMLLSECEQAKVEIRLNTDVEKIEKISNHHYKTYMALTESMVDIFVVGLSLGRSTPAGIY